jgi:predicted DNA-binding protein (UPF0278 family)
LEIDPYRAPTEEEIEQYGDGAVCLNSFIVIIKYFYWKKKFFFFFVDAAPNIARDIVNDVRKRKGLFVREKIVEKAEKQKYMSNA